MILTVISHSSVMRRVKNYIKCESESEPRVSCGDCSGNAMLYPGIAKSRYTTTSPVSEWWTWCNALFTHRTLSIMSCRSRKSNTVI